MTTTPVTMSRSDISLSEVFIDALNLTEPPTRRWQASFNGPLSSGEYVSFSFEGDTVAATLAGLTAIGAENGWSFA